MRDVATDVLIDLLDGIDIGERPLLVDEETGRLENALFASNVQAVHWLRRSVSLYSDVGAAAWPPPGDFTSSLIRLPKSKQALDFALAAAASVVSAGSAIVLFGANGEGVRSAATRLSVVADDVATIATRRHCRVLLGRRRSVIEGHRQSLAAWRTIGEIDLLGVKRPWVAYPGVFAEGDLDAGTALLIGTLDPSSKAKRVLDFAGGTGVMAAAVRQLMPAAHIDLIEIDALALAAARENVPSARLLAGQALGAAGDQRYDFILSNPPIHDGIAEDHRVLEALITEAPHLLNANGELRIVVQRRIAASRLMEATFGMCDLLAENGGFRVLAARRR